MDLEDIICLYGSIFSALWNVWRWYRSQVILWSLYVEYSWVKIEYLLYDYLIFFGQLLLQWL